MTVLTTTKDVETLTLTLVAEFDAAPGPRLGGLEDAQTRALVGPPTYPATFTRHDFVVGGESRYFMTGPNGESPHGWWRIEAIDKPYRLAFANGLAGDDGEPAPGVLPMSAFVTLEPVGDTTRMTAVTKFVDIAQMEAMVAGQMREGMTQAIGQIDALLSAASV